MMRILVVSANASKRRALVQALEAEMDRIEVDCARDTEEALTQLDRFSYKVAVLLPARVDAQLFAAIRAVSARINVMVAALPKDPDVFLRCFQAGALNCASQDEPISEIGKKIRGTKERKAYLSPELANALITLVGPCHTQFLPSSSPQQLLGLSEREWEVLGYLEQGFSNQEIAEWLSITNGTVKNHIHSILKKLGAENRKQAVAVMRRMADR